MKKSIIKFLINDEIATQVSIDDELDPAQALNIADALAMLVYADGRAFRATLTVQDKDTFKLIRKNDLDQQEIDMGEVMKEAGNEFMSQVPECESIEIISPRGTTRLDRSNIGGE